MTIRMTKSAGLALTLACAATPLAAQGLDQPGAQGIENPAAVETIIGTPVQESERNAAADSKTVIAAIDDTPMAIALVRKASALDEVDIVFLPDASVTEGGPPVEIERKVHERRGDIDNLRNEIEGNAMIYHAINSRQILPKDVLAVRFENGDRRLVIYAAAKPPAR